MGKLWGKEPAMIVAAILAVISVARNFGLALDDVQVDSIQTAIESVLILIAGAVVRTQVTPTESVNQADV